MGFFITLLIQAALIVLSDVLRPRPEIENAKPAGLGDFRFPTSTEQRHVPFLWGTCRLEGPNVVWFGDLLQEAITEKIKTGLFSSETVVVGFRYFYGMQQAHCVGPVDDMLRLWIGDDLVLDAVDGSDLPVEHEGTFTIDRPDLFGGEDLGTGGVVGAWKFFAGTSSQPFHPYLDEHQGSTPGAGDTPGYRDVCYDAPNLERANFGTSTTVVPWSRELRRTPNGLGLGGGIHRVNEYDANPACVIYEILTRVDFGFEVDPSEIDVAQMTATATTLHSEGNGFSFLLDRPEDVVETLKRVNDQIDGITFKNPLTGKWQIRLIRDDYDPLTIPEVNETNLVELGNFVKATWEGTVNQVFVPFNQRDDEYKDANGFAQDGANVRIVGANVTSSIRHPGVKDSALADSIAFRELRTLSTPLASGEFVVDRSLHGVLPGDVVAFTSVAAQLTRLPMRVRSVDYGNLLAGEIRLTCTQDVFRAAPGAFGPPPGGDWEPPGDELADYGTNRRRAFEAPRMLTLRDPNSTDAETDKVYAFARRGSTEITFRMLERHAPGTPTGAFSEFGEVYGFALIGELAAPLPLSGANPVSSVAIVPTPDSQSALNAAFPDVSDLVELGTELLSLCMIDDEFVLVVSSQASGANVQLNDVYRGIGDSVQADHAAGAEVYAFFVGGGVSDSALPAGDNVEVKLIPRAFSEELAEGDATAISLAMSNRTRRPYPPASFDLNGVTLDTTSVDLDGSGSGEDAGILVDEVVRRDFRTIDELAATLTDASNVFADFPAANATEIEVEARDGATVLTSQVGISGTSATVRQLDVLEGLGTTSLPASLTVAVRQSHTLRGTVYKSLSYLACQFTVDSPLVGKHAFGVLDEGDASTIYEVQVGDDSTDHDFVLSTAFSVGDVEYRLDGGSWLTLISAGTTSGSIPNASLSVGTDVELRHLSTDVGPQKLLTMAVGGAERAYAVLVS